MKIKDPILLDLPTHIETARLVMRPVMPGDGKALFEAIDESREQFRLWLPWVDFVKTWQDSEKTAREFYANFICRKEITFVVLHENNLVGICGLKDLNWAIPSASIGYWCRKSAQGKGFIREATAALTVYGFKEMHLKRIELCCDDENNRSIRVAESLGFILESRANGIVENVRGEDLVMSRCYVRFDALGL